MIIERKSINIFGKKTFEIMVVKPPLVKYNLMENEACFLHIIEGSSTTISEVDRFSLQTKESVLMKCGNYISTMLPSTSANYFHSFAVHFHLDVLEKIYKNELPTFLTPDKNNTPKAFWSIENKSLINHFIEGMKIYFNYPSGQISEDLLVLKLKEILLLLYQDNDKNPIHDILGSLFSPITYSLRQIVEAHLYTDISVSQLATLCNMSMSTFKREFGKTYNDSPGVYLKNKKLEKSKELLAISDKRIGEIAAECGFNELSHFSKSFMHKYGKNPSEYRLNQIG